MAKEYKCARCGKPAVVHITKISGNEKLTLHLCEECAKKFALDDPNTPANLDPQLKQFEQQHIVKKPDGICPTCGSIDHDLKKGDKAACADCYSIMDASAADMLRQIQGAVRHTGKRPKFHAANVDTSKIFSQSADVLGKDFMQNLENMVASAIESVSEAQLEAEKIEFLDSEGDSDTAAPEPESERARLERELKEAVAQERYEDAAKIRDKINSLPKS